MEKNKNIKWDGTIRVDSPKLDGIVFYLNEDEDSFPVVAPTYEKATQLLQQKAQKLVSAYNKEIKKNGDRYFKKNEATNPRAEVQVDYDFLLKKIKKAKNLNDAVSIYRNIINQVHPNKNLSELFSDGDGGITIHLLGFPQVFGVAFALAKQDGINFQNLKKFYDLVLKRAVLSIIRHDYKMSSIEREASRIANEKNEEELKELYATELRDMYSEESRGILDSIYNFKTHEQLVARERQKDRELAYKRSQVAFEDGGIISGFEYTIGGL